MKSGKTLVELAQELSRIKSAARDFVAPVEMLKAKVVETATGKGIGLAVGDDLAYRLNPWSSSQVATYTDIPKGYFDRLATERPTLLSDNINHGLERVARAGRAAGKPEARLVRTLDGNVRGMMSSRYRILDAHDMLESVLPVALDRGLQVVSSEITERRLFLKFVSERLTAEVKKGDVVQFGLVVSTSDVGAGSVRAEPMLWRLACLNGMISSTAIRKFHIGKNQAEENIRELLSDRTREMTDAAFWAQVRDVVVGSMEPANFEKEVDRLRVAANEPIQNFDLPRVVELTMKATNVSGEGTKNSIVAALASGNEGAGLTKWGLINAFTRAAQSDAIGYEDGVELERAAGSILELPKSSWSHIASVPA